MLTVDIREAHVPPPWSVLWLLCPVPGNAEGPEKLWQSSRYLQQWLRFTGPPRERKPGHAAGQAENAWKNHQVSHVKSAYNTGLSPFLSPLRARDWQGPELFRKSLTSKVLSTCWQTPIRSVSPFRNGSTAGRAPSGRKEAALVKRKVASKGAGSPLPHCSGAARLLAPCPRAVPVMGRGSHSRYVPTASPLPAHQQQPQSWAQCGGAGCGTGRADTYPAVSLMGKGFPWQEQPKH